jgi:hypothetical protein
MTYARTRGRIRRAPRRRLRRERPEDDEDDAVDPNLLGFAEKDG